jgi:hypothetical protein
MNRKDLYLGSSLAQKPTIISFESPNKESGPKTSKIVEEGVVQKGVVRKGQGGLTGGSEVVSLVLTAAGSISLGHDQAHALGGFESSRDVDGSSTILTETAIVGDIDTDTSANLTVVVYWSALVE